MLANMSLLSEEIEKVREKLRVAVIQNHFDFQKDEVIVISQRLDRLLLQYEIVKEVYDDKAKEFASCDY